MKFKAAAALHVLIEELVATSACTRRCLVVVEKVVAAGATTAAELGLLPVLRLVAWHLTMRRLLISFLLSLVKPIRWDEEEVNLRWKNAILYTGWERWRDIKGRMLLGAGRKVE